MTKTFEKFGYELEDLIDDVLDDDISDNAFDEKKYKFIKKYAPQPLPVVPEFVGEFIESYKDRRTIYGVFDKISKNRKTYPKLYDWVFEDENSQATFALAFITGKYEVEKPQLFYLKNKLTTEYLAREDFNGYYCHVNNNNISNPYTKEFTQKEIDSMGNIDGYEKIEVE